MGKMMIIPAAIAAIATAAGAFFDPPANPAARSTTCTLAVTWDPADPDTVRVRYVDHRIGGPVTACGATEDLAIANALRELLRH
jgi:hypothetical protein